MKFLLVSPKNRTVYNFRGDLIREIKEAGYEVLVTGPDRTDIEKIEELGVRFFEIPMNKTGTSVIGDLRYCRRLYQLMKAEKPDVVLGYTVKPNVYGSIAAKLAGVKKKYAMVTGGGYTFTSKSFKAKVLGVVVRMLYKVGFGCCTRVIFQNKDDLQEFTQNKLTRKEKCSVVNGSGVNIERYEPLPYPQTITFFMLSRLLKSKGVVEYLRAAELVWKKHPEVKFTLLGKYETQMQDAVDRAYVEDLVARGVVERYEETTDVRPYYAGCSVYVLPSYREGVPRTVLEAAAMARPIITTDTNGCRDTVIDGKTGFLVPVKNVDALAEKMLYFIENPDEISKMGEHSREYCIDRFSVEKVNAEMLRIMEL